MEVRIIKSCDLSEYKRIRLEGLKVDPESFGSSFEEESIKSDDFFIDRITQSNCNFVVGAFDKEILVATAGFYRENSPKLFHKGFLVGVYVNETYRGRALGKRLVEFVISEVRKLRDISKIQLRVISSNKIAEKLYLSCGFCKEGFENDAIRVNGISYDEKLMVLYLNGKT